MSDPLSFLPLALAAHGGRVDEHEAQRLVAAGFTLLQRSVALVRALGGKRAALLLPTSPQFFVALAAAEGRGAVLVNPLAAAPEIAYQISDANVGAVFTVQALASRVPEHVTRVLLDDAPRSARVLFDGVAREIDLGSHFGLSLEGDAGATGSDDEAAIVYTSAMASRPLGAILSHRNLLANARSTVQAGQQTAEDRVLALLPFSHLFGLTVTASAPLLSGAQVVTMARFNPVRAAELIASGEITEVVGVPAIFHALLAALERVGGSAGALRLCICGGAVLPIELQHRWADRTGVELRQGYGLTEAAPVCLFNHVGEPNARGALGRPFPGVAVSIREPIAYNESGLPQIHWSAEMPEGSVGEICVKGENVFAGYLSHERAGLPVIDGWLHTGDLGHQRQDGRIVFHGMVKPMSTRNGFNVYPREVEAAVLEMPGVHSARVRFVADPTREHDIVLTVSGRVDESAVREWCESRLAAYKQPSTIEIE
ncbi:MAG TPA: AMP-binding protein [Gemmatimonadaceae bacterium]